MARETVLDSRQEILRTAARLFQQRGYDATSMNDVAAALNGARDDAVVEIHLNRLTSISTSGTEAAAAKGEPNAAKCARARPQ